MVKTRPARLDSSDPVPDPNLRAVSPRVRFPFLASLISGLYVAVFLVWVIAGPGTARQRTIISDIAPLPLGPGAAFCAWRAGLSRLPSRGRRGWNVIALALLSWGLGDLLWCFLEVVLNQAPFPSVADAFYLGFYPILVCGLVLVAPEVPRNTRVRNVLDALTVTVVASIIVWLATIRPSAGMSVGLVAKVLNLAYPVGDVLAAFGIAVILLRRPPRSTAAALRVLILGTFAFVAADIVYAHLSLSDSYTGGDLPDALWMIALWLFLVAAQLQRRLAIHSQEAAPRSSFQSINPLPYLAVLVGFAILFYQVHHQEAEFVGLWVAAFAIVALVSSRQLLAIADNARLTHELVGFERVIESSQDAIYSQLLTGRILSWNPAAERMFGFRADEVIGIEATAYLVPRELHAKHEDHLRSASLGQPVRGLVTAWTHKDGRTVPVSVSISPVHDISGRVVGVSVIAQDVSDQQRLAVELEAALHRAEIALAETRSVEKATRQFLADAAHQLRSPVAGLQACAEALLRGAPPERCDALLRSIGQEASRAGRLVANLLAIARLDQGSTLRMAPTDLHGLCREEASRLQARTGREVVVAPSNASGRLIQLDTWAVREVLANLLDNASRHARSRVEVLLDEAPDRLEVRVRDDGEGIAPHLVPSAFERFVTLDGKGGSGLGLAIARGLARAHHGDLTYDGDFVLSLPDRGDSDRAIDGGYRQGALSPTPSEGDAAPSQE